MKFKTHKPNTLFSHSTRYGIHYFGTSDSKGILDISSNDKYFNCIASKFDEYKERKPRLQYGQSVNYDTEEVKENGDNDKTSNEDSNVTERNNAKGSKAHSQGK